MKAILASLALSLLCSQAFAQEIRNITEAIPGKLVRSGTTHQTPFSDQTLYDLCEKGYTLAIYVYAKGRNTDVKCSRGTISYRNITSWQKPATYLPLVEQHMKAGGKVVIHCWNGVHASNYATAVALNQFCGYSGAQTESTWLKGFKAGTLPQKTVNQLASQLSNLPSGGSVMEGCPAPR